ncbi:nitroreductase/quinone reductase family protein [Planotetraspora sp. GP83]|uniref:nitroreductase/quinone reductase family protein n=1 Tax=Planotetraspora sp. GP83 TaxID=3156264 RepID=UPI003519AC77
MTASQNTLPDITLPSACTVLIAESPIEQVKIAELEHVPWPKGLLSYSAFLSTDGETVLTYTQWTYGEADREFLAGLTGAEPVEYSLYRSRVQDEPSVPGCVVVVSAEFDGPDPERQRRWVDTVFEALDAETEPPPGGISGHFHLSTDGTRVVNYAEWTDEQAHRDAIERSGQGTVGSSPEWRRVLDFSGVRSGGFRRYRLLRSLSAPPSDEVLDSPTKWVAEHVRAYVETDGKSGHMYQGWPTLLLTTRGRKSGMLRRTALIYGQDGDRYLLVGSNGGSPHHPAWYLNLVANPAVTVQVGSDRFTARARLATAEEKPRLWERMTAIFPLYDTYQSRAGREIPLVVIEREGT